MSADRQTRRAGRAQGRSTVGKVSTGVPALASDLIEVAAAQIETSIDFARGHEGDCTGALARVCEIADGQCATESAELRAACNQAIVALQFVDALAQRLDHVHAGLAGIARTLREDPCLDTPSAWDALATETSAAYSTREEHEVFERVMADTDTTAGKAGAERGDEGGSGPATGGGMELF